MVANNRGRLGKTLWTDLGEGDPIKIRECDDEHAEARFVVAEVERLVDEGVSRNEVAIFYRTNAQSRVLEDMLTRANVAFQVIGGTKFYDRAEVKDALAYLSFLVNHAGRRGVHADRELAEARHRPDLDVARARAREHDGAHAVGGGIGRGRTCRRSAPRR